MSNTKTDANAPKRRMLQILHVQQSVCVCVYVYILGLSNAISYNNYTKQRIIFHTSSQSNYSYEILSYRIPFTCIYYTKSFPHIYHGYLYSLTLPNLCPKKLFVSFPPHIVYFLHKYIVLSSHLYTPTYIQIYII